VTGAGKKRIWFVLVLVAAAAAGAWWYLRANGGLPGQTGNAIKATPAKGPSSIAALGRIEPKDGIVSISGRALAGQPSIVGEIKVHEGDWVKAGQVVAVLDSHRQLEESARDLSASVAVAESRLAVAKTGARKGDLAVQQAEIARLEAALAAAKIDADRYEQLYQKQAATVIERDQRRLQVETTTQMLNGARNRLLSLEEVRDVDVKLAEAEVQAARANVARAESEIEPTLVHAPFSGRVLKVSAHQGEEVGPKGILDLGRTDQMYVIAEVFESDVDRLRVGQKATITSEAFKGPLHGEVDSIGSQVAKQDIQPTDPVSFSDARIVEVKVRLAESAMASHLIHGKVTVVIEP
jgi:HlyD family secretion protein